MRVRPGTIARLKATERRPKGLISQPIHPSSEATERPGVLDVGPSYHDFADTVRQICEIDMSAAGSQQWSLSQVRDNKGSSVTAALPPEFQRQSLERGLWPLRLPDVKPPCILAPGE